MNRRNSGGWGLMARMLALVAVPLVLVGVLTIERTSSLESDTQVAHQMTSLVKLEEAVAAVQLPAYAERLSTVGLSTVDQLKVPRPLVIQLTGLDVSAMVVHSRADLNVALDALQEQVASLAGSDSVLAADLAAWRTRMIAERGTVDAQAGDPAVAGELFDQLETIGRRAVLAAENRITDGGLRAQILDDYERLHAVSHMVTAAGDRANAVLVSVIRPDRDHFANLISAQAIFRAEVDDFAEHLAPEEAARFRQLTATATIPDELLTRPTIDPVAGSFDPAVVGYSAAAITTQMAFLKDMAGFVREVHESVVTQTELVERQVGSRMRQGALRLWGTLAVTLLMVAILGRSMLVPLRRLSQRAVAINLGATQLGALRPSGPRDVRQLAMAMNDMLGTLQLIDRQTAALAEGDLHSTALSESVPGDVGRSIRDSVNRVAQLTSELHESEALASAIIDNAADAIWTVSTHGDIQSANLAAERMVGRNEQQQIGDPIATVLSGDRGEQRVRANGVDPIEVAVHSVAVPSGGSMVRVVFAHDVSATKRFEQRLVHQARHDSLTGLPNRFAVLDDLEQLLRESNAPCAVLFIDIDGFKSVNDSHGHGVGDFVLQEVAGRIQRHARGDDLVARLGGDEFLVVMRAMHALHDAIEFAGRLIREIEQPYRQGEHLFTMSASVGVALVQPGTEALTAVQRADAAVYLAKRHGRGRVEVFNQELQSSIEQRAEMEMALRDAIRQGELSLHLQPIVDLTTDAYWGAEVLARWTRAGGLTIAPDDFIPVAEESSLIFELQQFVLGEACRILADWQLRDPGCKFRIAVNISGRHLTDGTLVADIRDVLAATGADPRLLELELTETHLLVDLGRARAILDELRAMGIAIVVDDFGTGYSSMTYLRELPVDCVKIDRSFVANATDDGYDAAVIEALLSIGRTLDLSIVAEGIETADQLDYVRSRGVDRGQGFLLGRPMPRADVELVLFGAPSVGSPPNVDEVEQLPVLAG
jgi:diguanylate cyclase (GGDEF)-like protein